jgi:hypothetical protein
MSSTDTVDFAPAILSSLAVLVPPDQLSTDLACELGISAWLRRTGTPIEDAPGRLWAARQALLEAGGMDAGTEPIPMGARTARLDLLNLVGYLADLVGRAAAHRGCDRATIVVAALARPILQGGGTSTSAFLRQRRSS